MHIMSRARAQLDRVPIHAQAVLIGIVRSDSGKTTSIGFTSFRSLYDFLEAMKPRALHFLVAPGEDPQGLGALVERAADAGATLQ